MQSIFVFWPYLLSAAAVGLWSALLWRRIDRRVQFLIVAFVACTLVNMAIEFACAYLVPLDIAGSAPPDPRNAFLRALITAAVQAPVSLVLAGWLAALSARKA